MKRKLGFLILSALVLIACAVITVHSPAQAGSNNGPANARWMGVWQGQSKGMPGLTLTLGADLGEVNGTIVLNVMRDGTIVGHMAHVIMHPHVDGNTLSFQVKRDEDSTEILDMSVEPTGEDNAQLRCPKCGVTFSMAMERIL